MEFNEWYLQNGALVGFINIAATVLLTALNVWFARNSQKYSADTVRQNEEIRAENNTPNIIAHIDINNVNLCFFNLSNHGTIAAKDIKITLVGLNGSTVPELFSKTYMYNNEISFLAPNQTLKALMSYDSLYANGIDNLPSYQLVLNYSDIDNRQYVREYILDLNMYSYQYEVRRDIHDLTKEIKKIEQHVKKAVDMKVSEKRMEQAIKSSTTNLNRKIKNLK